MTATTPSRAPAVSVPPAPTAAPRHPVGWWGVVGFMATEATIFATLLAAYFFVRAGSPAWPQGGIEVPELKKISVATVVLLSSSIPLFVAEPAARKGNIRRVRAMLAVTFVMGAAFSVHQAMEYQELTFGIRDNAYASLFYVITGLHGIHVLVGLLMSLVVQAKAWTGRITAERTLTLTVYSYYWHLVDVVWIFVFSSLYLSAHVR
ncbi:MAG: cytochrome c oxidase subunit 3 [Acidimicrobiales bacterium]